MKRPKYGNKRTVKDGLTFDSKKEAKRYGELSVMLAAGLIKDLQLQVKYQLLPNQKDAAGKVAERAITYVADFTYTIDGDLIVEDAKGMRTDVYKIKKKLMRYFHGIKIREV